MSIGLPAVLVVAASLLLGCVSAASKQEESPVISLKRTQCLGSCPVYEVSIMPSGEVEFFGREYVRDQGRNMSRIDRVQHAKVLDATAGLSRFRHEYDHGMCDVYSADFPGQVISLRTGSTETKVFVNFGCSGPDIDADIRALRSLGELIDEVTDTKRWIGPLEAWRETSRDPRLNREGSL